MSDKKVKISNILGSQIPDFIQADNPLFIEFLTQYYESEEREYGSTYLSDNISSLKKISTVADISLVEKQTVPAPNSTNPESPVILASLTYAFDDIINVNQTTGFPDKYGLLKIDNEITLSFSLSCMPFIPFEDLPLKSLNFLDLNLMHFPN